MKDAIVDDGPLADHVTDWARGSVSAARERAPSELDPGLPDRPPS